MHVHAHAGTRVHEANSLSGLVPERVQLTVHTTEPTGTVPEPFHCDHIVRCSVGGTVVNPSMSLEVIRLICAGDIFCLLPLQRICKNF